MKSAPKQIIVSGGFDDIRSSDLRFLEEAAKLGEVTVWLWPDEVLRRFSGSPPCFTLAERLYFLNAVRFVHQVMTAGGLDDPKALPEMKGFQPEIWADRTGEFCQERRDFCQKRGLEYHVFSPDQLKGFPGCLPAPSLPGRKKVIVTGCYDWFHSGHVRFFEQVSAYGDLHVIVGHDANIRLLKGEGHPLLPEEERRYLVGSIRHVKQALVSSGDGWLDADPEIRRLRPDLYVVNEDGDKGGKREYCRKLGIEYLVLKREPAPGLPKRSSTDLRWFQMKTKTVHD